MLSLFQKSWLHFDHTYLSVNDMRDFQVIFPAEFKVGSGLRYMLCLFQKCWLHSDHICLSLNNMRGFQLMFSAANIRWIPLSKFHRARYVYMKHAKVVRKGRVNNPHPLFFYRFPTHPYVSSKGCTPPSGSLMVACVNVHSPLKVRDPVKNPLRWPFYEDRNPCISFSALRSGVLKVMSKKWKLCEADN